MSKQHRSQLNIVNIFKYIQKTASSQKKDILKVDTVTVKLHHVSPNEVQLGYKKVRRTLKRVDRRLDSFDVSPLYLIVLSKVDGLKGGQDNQHDRMKKSERDCGKNRHFHYA